MIEQNSKWDEEYRNIERSYVWISVNLKEIAWREELKGILRPVYYYTIIATTEEQLEEEIIKVVNELKKKDMFYLYDVQLNTTVSFNDIG